MYSAILIPIITGFVGLLLICIVFKLRKIIEDDRTNNHQRPIIDHLWKANPLNVKNGWILDSVVNGVAVWWKKENRLSIQHGIFGCQALVQATAEDAITQLLQPKILALTDMSIENIHIIPNHGSRASQTGGFKENVDSLMFEEKTSKLPRSFMLESLYISWKQTHKVKRVWGKSSPSQHYLVLIPDTYLYGYKYGVWTSILIKELQGSGGDRLSLLTITSAPIEGNSIHSNIIKNHISSQILCIREHFDSLFISKAVKASSVSTAAPCNSTNTVANEDVTCKVGTTEGPGKSISEEKPKGSPSKNDFGAEEVPAPVTCIPVSVNEVAASVKYEIPKEVLEYSNFIQDALNLLYDVYKADDNTPGWSFQGNTRGVNVYKMYGDSKCPSDCYKGTTDIQAPLAYALQYCASVDYKLDWDEFYSGGSILHDLDLITKVSLLEYKPIWPTSGRYFVSLSCTRHLRDNLYGIVVKSIDYPFQGIKGKVRGEIIIGGFVIEEICKDPPCTRVTYITRADLKGNVPARLVNKVSSAQPLYANKIREKMEGRLETEDPPIDYSILDFTKNYPSFFEEPKPPSEPVVSPPADNDNSTLGESSVSDDSSKHNSDTAASTIEQPKVSLLSGIECDTLGLMTRKDRSQDNVSVCSTDTSLPECSPSEFGDETSPISDHDFELPRDQRGNIDFQTLGNQSSALLLQEVLYVSKLGIHDSGQEIIGEWIYQGTKKNIKMYRKIHKEESIHSFIGFGEIDVVSTVVWDAIRNPATRFIYDSMLKSTKIIREIGKAYKIIHMKHETTACFVKQARDFVVLTNERTEGNRCVLSGISVNIPECPPEKGFVRGQILSGGWIIEPILKGRRSCSQVTYLSQVDFGGRLPVRLVNHIARRQPLSIAYLRDYLESSNHT